MSNYTGLEIAVIGMSGQFPGATDLHQFWDNLKNGVESITGLADKDIVEETGNKHALNEPAYVKANAFIDGKEYFDAGFFGYRPEEAAIMDPQIRLFHEHCWKAVEDAGYNVNRITDKVGVFAGATSNFNWEAFSILSNRNNEVDDFTASQLRNVNYLCSKVAYQMNLQGPVLFLNTACSTSLVAIERAMMSLLLRECSMALAGGITINNYTHQGYVYKEGMILSKDGHCRPFDKNASGTVAGEGVGVVLLKRLNDAIKDRDSIYAVIKGGAVNNDGHQKISFTAPSSNGQYLAILKALNMARIEPSSISYVEAHGTGTLLGDPIEAEALNNVFGESDTPYCALGSVKSNVGHCDAAAGVAGFIKTVLSLHHKKIPASLHYQSANPEIDFSKSALYVNTELQEWITERKPLRAGVSSFGIGGTNAHVILEESPVREASSESRSSQLLLFSGKTTSALENNLAKMRRFLSQPGEEKLADIAYTLQTGRSHFACRKAIVCNSKEDALAKLEAIKEGSDFAALPEKRNRKTVFMFPGQGAQYQQMCYGLYQQEEAFRSAADTCFNIVKHTACIDLKELLFSAEAQDKIDQTAYTQPLLFIVEYALARQLQSWGIQPDVMIGHSIGEYVAACISGVFSLEDALALVVKRGALMQQAPRGIMLSIPASEEEIRELINNHPGISLASVNSTANCVVAGEADTIHAFKAILDTAGYNSRVIRTSHAFHSHLMESVVRDFEQEVKKITPGVATIPFISNRTGKYITPEQYTDPSYWSLHLRETVNFKAGLDTLLHDEEVVFVEAGPGKSLSSFVRSHGQRTPRHKVISLVRHVQEDGVQDMEQLLKALGELWMEGIEPSWNDFYAKETRNKVSIPAYAFDKAAFPVNVNAPRMIAGMITDKSEQKNNDVAQWLYIPTWKLSPLTAALPAQPGRYSVLFCDGMVGRKLQAKLEAAGEQVIRVTIGKKFREISPLWYELNPAEMQDYTLLITALANRNYEVAALVHAWNMLQPVKEEEEQVKNTGFYSLVGLLKALAAAGKLAGKNLALLTSDLHPVLDKVRGNPLQSLAAGLIKVIGQEYPGISASHIDISTADMENDEVITSLSAEIVSPKHGRVITYRHGARWERLYEKADTRREMPVPLKNAGVYVITGGLGAAGSSIAAYLLQQFGATVILLGRTRLPDPTQWESFIQNDSTASPVRTRLLRLQQLTKAGGRVIYKECNTSNENSLSATFNEIESTAGRINGIIHAAGETPGNSLKMMAELTRSEFEKYFEAKVKGLSLLKNVTDKKDIDFVWITSSLSAILGGIGFGGYAPANNYIDYFISSQQANGQCRHWQSINLDGFEPEENYGEHGIGKEELNEVLRRTLAMLPVSSIAVSAKDLVARLEKWQYAGNSREEELPAATGITAPAEQLMPDTAPQNATLQKLTAIWKQFFGRSAARNDDDFFETGGDSLKALTFINRIYKTFQVEVPVKDFFNHSTLAKLCEYIQSKKTAAGNTGEQAGNRLNILRCEHKSQYTLSAAQKRLYFLYEFDNRSLAYNMPRFMKLEGYLDKEYLEELLQKLVARHESLRTSFVLADGEPVQQVAGQINLPLEYYPTKPAEIPDRIKQFIRPFDLSNAPLIRVGLLAISARKHLLMVDIHHIINDGISEDILVKDFMALYSQQTLAPLQLQYKDFAEWQQSAPEQERIAEQKTFWLKEFAEDVMPLELPVDYTRPTVKTEQGHYYNFSFGASQTAGLRNIASAEGASLFMVLLALYNILLSKLSNQEDIVVGIPTAGRQHADLEGIIGMFVNTLPVRNYPQGSQSFKELLAAVKAKMLAVLENQEYQYEDLIEALHVTRDMSRNPLFDVVLSYQNYEEAALELPGLKISGYNRGYKPSKFDLSLVVWESNKELQLSFEYSTALFRHDTITQFAAYLQQVANTVIKDPEVSLAGIEIITKREKHQLLYGLNNAGVDYPKKETIVSLFTRQAIKHAGKIAVECQGKQLTYRELDERSNQLAGWLKSEGVAPGTVVALLTDRSIHTITGMLAVLKAGGAYLPVDVDYPAERIQYLLADSGAKIVLTTEKDPPLGDAGIKVIGLKDKRISSFSKLALPAVNQPSDTCYIIYTSGTTGNPKGVMIEHRNVVRLLFNDSFQFNFSESDTWTMFHSHCFDFSVWEIYGALLYGGKLIVIPKEVAKDPSLYLKILKEKQVTVVNQTPSAFYNLVQADQEDKKKALRVRYVIFGGEALQPAKLKPWYEKYPDTKLINMYGITETTVHVTYKEIGATEIEKNISNIGRPIPTLSAYVFDKYRKLVPQGVKGELYVGGEGVGRGYLNREALTKERFIDNPYNPGERLYKSGDLVKIMPGGELEYLGRMDEQVKIRGYRIELGEIEQQLRSYDGMKEVVVIAREHNGSKQLIAYYVSPARPDASVLRSYLLQRLPDYMVPAFFVPMEHFPLTGNGKLDRKALPDPGSVSSEEYIAPVTTAQQLLAAIWSKVLGVERVGIRDNFFSAGGDSIKSIQIIARVRAAGYELAVKDIFSSQTIELLATRLKKTESIADQSMVTGKTLLSPVQRWFFDQHRQYPHHYNQAVMLHFKEGIRKETVAAIFKKIQEHHDGLRTVFQQTTQGWKATVLSAEQLGLSIKEQDLRQQEDAAQQLAIHCEDIQGTIDLENGPLLRLGLFHLHDGSRLLIAIHHLVTDGVSWRILFEDIQSLYEQWQRKEKLSLPLKTMPFRDWMPALQQYSNTPAYTEARNYWDRVMHTTVKPLPRDVENGSNCIKDEVAEVFRLNPQLTSQLLTRAHTAYHTRVNDILLTGLLLAMHQSYGAHDVLVNMEGHGREAVLPGLNSSRTIGWFTSIYPVLLTYTHAPEGSLLKAVKESLRQVPNNGIDYLLAKYLHENESGNSYDNKAMVSFNYLGQFDTDVQNRSYHIAGEPSGNTIHTSAPREHDWDITGIVVSGQLEIRLHYSRHQYHTGTIQRFMEAYRSALESLVNHCCEQARSQLTPSDLTYSRLSMQELDSLQAKQEISDIYPLSPMQEGMLFHSLLDKTSLAYFEQIMYRWEGNLDKDAVKRCMQQVMQRYDILHTVFVHEGYGRPLQLVLKHAEADCTFKDTREKCMAEDRNTIVNYYLEEDRRRNFDLSKDVLMRLLILQTGNNTYEFIWSHHHILMDGWCVGLVIADFRTLYENEIAGKNILLEPVPPYARYIQWLEKRDTQASVDFWRTYLEGYETIPVFPEKQPAVSLTTEQRFSSHLFSLDEQQAEKLKILSAQCGVTINTVVQTLWGILAARYNNTSDIVFGSVVSGRSAEVENIEKMVGLFINTIPVRIRFEAGDSLLSLVQRVQEEALQAEPHHYHPLAEIQGLSSTGRNLVNHIIAFENYPVAQELSDNGKNNNAYRITNVEVLEQTNYDLSLMVIPGRKLLMRMDYNTTRYEQPAIETIALQLQQLFRQFLQDHTINIPAIELVTEHEKKKLLIDFNHTQVAYAANKNIIGLFEEQCKKGPHNTAIHCGNNTVSYAQLNTMADAIAGMLIEKAAPSVNDKIAFLSEPSVEMVAMMLGILKSGCAYVALSPEAPIARNQLIYTDANAKALLIQKSLLEQQPRLTAVTKEKEVLVIDEHIETGVIRKPVYKKANGKDRLIYVIYTSGSTGTPKGVEVKMSGIMNMIHFYHQAFRVQAADKISQVANICFDASAFEIWPCLAGGGELHISSAETRLDASLMEKWLISRQINIAFQPPVIAELLLKRKEIIRAGSLRIMNVAGDVLNYFPSEKLPFRLFNLYGPTEDSIWTTWKELRFNEPAGSYSIGKPIANKKIYILDKQHQLLPIGVAGELCIGGKGLAKGYLNNEALTNEKFINNPFVQGERLYKTGDLAKWTATGELEFLGRIDQQVKIRGFRVEVGEIETRLKEIDQVNEAAVVVFGEQENKYLAAYYTSSYTIQAQLIRKQLAERLPDYMIPAFFIQLEKMPYAISGKLDRKSLPEPVFEGRANMVAPVTDIQKDLVTIWSGILGVARDRIGVTDNFFDIGGNSIRLMNMVEQVNARFNTRLSVASIFKFPEIASIAGYITDKPGASEENNEQEEQAVEQARKTLSVLNSM